MRSTCTSLRRDSLQRWLLSRTKVSAVLHRCEHRPLPSSKHVNVLHYYTCAPSRGIEGHKSFQQQKWSVNNRNSFQLFWWLYLQLCSGIGITTSHLLEISHSLSVTDHRMVCYHQFEHVAHIFWSSVLSQQRQISEKNILVNMTRLVLRLPFFQMFAVCALNKDLWVWMSSVMLSKPLRNSWTLCALVAFLHAV